MKWVTSLLGLALPSWVLPVSVVGVLVFSLGGAYLKGRHDANENCKAATLEAQIKKLRGQQAALGDEAYYAQLEKLLRELAAVYAP